MTNFAMELNITTLIGAMVGALIGSLTTGFVMISKFDRRLAIVETNTKSLPGLAGDMKDIQIKLAHMEGRQEVGSNKISLVTERYE